MPDFTARQARQLTNKFTAQLTGRTERGPDRKVRRDSVDVEDKRAKVFRPIGDGTTAGALGWIDCLLKTVAEWDDLERRTGGARPLGLAGMRVLETLLGRRGGVAIDFRTGRLDPAIDTIAKVARLSRTTVVRALARLQGLKILRWIRRTQKTGNVRQFGPQREQVSNAYWFDLRELPARVLQRFRDLMARKQLRRANEAQPVPPRNARPSDAGLAAAIESLGAALSAREGHASPPSGQYPLSGVKG